MVLSGATFGLVGVVEMMTPFHVSAGLFYDSRSILLSTAGMFGGPVIGGIAAGICTVYRVAVGGVGMYVGVGTILEATGLGIVMYYARRRYPRLGSVLSLWVFGLLVHLIMLLIMLGLPATEAEYVFMNLSLPVLGLYPLGNVIVGWLLLDQEERRATDTKLAESEGRYRSMFLHSQAVMLIVDVDQQRFLDANPAAAEYYGYSREVLIGMSVGDINILPAEELNVRMEEAKRRKVHYFSFKHRLASNEIRDVEVFSGPIHLDGSTYLFSIVHDVTDRRRMERELIEALDRAESADRLKDLFIANISHEIRTPLNIILGYINMLEVFMETDLTEEAARMVESVTQAGTRLMKTVDAVLTFSSITARAYEPTFKAVRLAPMLIDLHAQVEPLAAAKSLAITLEAGDRVPRVYCDPYTVEQAVANLLENAIKFTHEGSITIGLHQCGGYVCISVADTGVGISPEYMAHMFTAFSQEHTGYTRPFEGIGLGLSLVERYAEINKGRVTVESTKGVGSTFVLWIPIAHAYGELHSDVLPDARRDTLAM